MGCNGVTYNAFDVDLRCPVIHDIPDGLSFCQAALTEPCCVAYNATCVHSRIQPGANVAIIGPGPIGLLCASMTKIAGAGRLVVIGIPADAKRLEIAAKLGADTVLARTNLGTAVSSALALRPWEIVSSTLNWHDCREYSGAHKPESISTNCG